MRTGFARSGRPRANPVVYRDTVYDPSGNSASVNSVGAKPQHDPDQTSNYVAPDATSRVEDVNLGDRMEVLANGTSAKG
jgi:hypothetical protein